MAMQSDSWILETGWTNDDTEIAKGQHVAHSEAPKEITFVSRVKDF